MTNLEAAKHFNTQLQIAKENDVIVPEEYIRDIYKRFTTAYSGLICELIDKGLNTIDAANEARSLLAK